MQSLNINESKKSCLVVAKIRLRHIYNDALLKSDSQFGVFAV